MFLSWKLCHFIFQHLKSANQFLSCLGGLYHFVNKSSLGSTVRVAKHLDLKLSCTGPWSQKYKFRADRKIKKLAYILFYSGIFPCFFLGSFATLFSSISKARISFCLVWEGSITSSINPRSAAR